MGFGSDKFRDAFQRGILSRGPEKSQSASDYLNQFDESQDKPYATLTVSASSFREVIQNISYTFADKTSSKLFVLEFDGSRLLAHSSTHLVYEQAIGLLSSTLPSPFRIVCTYRDILSLLPSRAEAIDISLTDNFMRIDCETPDGRESYSDALKVTDSFVSDVPEVNGYETLVDGKLIYNNLSRLLALKGIGALAKRGSSYFLNPGFMQVRFPSAYAQLLSTEEVIGAWSEFIAQIYCKIIGASDPDGKAKMTLNDKFIKLQWSNGINIYIPRGGITMMNDPRIEEIGESYDEVGVLYSDGLQELAKTLLQTIGKSDVTVLMCKYGTGILFDDKLSRKVMRSTGNMKSELLLTFSIRLEVLLPILKLFRAKDEIRVYKKGDNIWMSCMASAIQVLFSSLS